MRGRIAAAGLTALVLVAMVASFGAPAASAACPNEAFRTGPSAFLPECRAYEMVTPVDKESGNGVYERGGGAHATASGDGIYFNSVSAYAGQQGSLYYNPYVGLRAGDTWATEGIGGPQAITFGLSYIATGAVSDDLSYSFLASKEALAPGAVAEDSNLYVRDNRTGTYALVASVPGNTEYVNWVGLGSLPPFVDATPDWSDILVQLSDGLYEFREGRLFPAVAGGRAGGSEIAPNQMSSDGTRFYYKDAEAILHLHQRGGEDLRVSEDEDGEPIPLIQENAFVGATADGGVAFFKESPGLFRFEASAPPGARVTRLTPPVDLEGATPNVLSAYTGEDGTTVYLAARNRLTADAAPIESFLGYDLYVWHGERGRRGQLSYIGNSQAEEALGPLTAGVSPNGRYFDFETFGAATPDAVEGSASNCPGQRPGQEPPGRCSNVFLYSLDTGRLVCVSCDGSPPVGNSSVGGAYERVSFLSVPRSVLDDGTVYFDTPNALSPRDVDGVLDPYSYRAGQEQLISSGTSNAVSGFVDASADGSDVFFQTQQPLVGQDIDTSVDVYDSRVEGGLPQGGAPPQTSCVTGNSCRAGVAPTAPPAQLGSGTVGGGREGAVGCESIRDRARAARKHSRTLARRARHAGSKRARSLRKGSARESAKARLLVKRAGHCEGGGR